MNSFGTATQQFPLHDVREVLANRSRFRREAIPDLAKANHVYVPNGRWAMRGFLLMDRASYNQINTYSDALQLNIGNTSKPNNVATLQNISIVHAQCVTRGLASSPNALYLVEITDDRGILHNEWFSAPITKAYNIRAAAYPEVFTAQSMNGGTTWTWSTMLQDMWNNLNTIDGGNVLGPWPGLPSSPTGIPEAFYFPGIPGWLALNDVLDHLGMTVACDLTKANPFTIVTLGNADANLSALQTKYASNLEDDLEWIDTGAARVPLNVTVAFRRRGQVFGIEETYPYSQTSPAAQWDVNSSYYSVTFQAPAFFTGAVGSHLIWVAYTVRYDQDGNPLAADTAMANTIAQERVTQYFNVIYRQTSGYMTQTYTGALPFATGSQVDGVCWYMDPEGDGGWRTKIERGDYPPFKGVWEE